MRSPMHASRNIPLTERDASKLLIAKPNEPLRTQRFTDLAAELPANARLVLNETKVVPARLVMHKDTGARIELFCLEPEHPSNELSVALGSGSPAVWRCLVGNAKKWKPGQGLSLKTEYDFELHAEKLEPVAEGYRIRYEWAPASFSFAEILHLAGQVPLPPYMNRDAEDSDLERYQTVFAKHDGAVAAPTASLHFTDRVFERLAQKGIAQTKLTLHVGAGTFKPVSVQDATQHAMHGEQLVVSRAAIEALANHSGPIVPVGTTSLRTLESLYWYALSEMKPSGNACT